MSIVTEVLTNTAAKESFDRGQVAVVTLLVISAAAAGL
jgi:hypothetical protein